MTHLTREELERWWQSDQLADRSRIIGHLAECDECGVLYGSVIDSRPVTAVEAPSAPGNLVARAHRVFRKPPQVWRSWTIGVGATAAAALLLAIAIPMLRAPGSGDLPRDAGIRGSSLQALSPIGAVVPPVRFRWASPVAADRFAVEIRDEQQSLVLALSSATEAVTLSDDQRKQLIPGRTYHWQVIAFGPGGDEITRAPVRSFVISPR